MNLYYITQLDSDMGDIIFSYMRPSSCYMLNKKQYISYHKDILIKTTSRTYHNFIRDILRNEREFVFSQIVKEHYNIWVRWNLYRFKNSIYNNYVSYILQFCIDHNSPKCRQILFEANNNNTAGIRKKRHKNVRTKNTSWSV